MLAERENELFSPVCKKAIVRIAHSPWSFAGVRYLGMHAVGERIVEV
jgi:hypothetical protein